MRKIITLKSETKTNIFQKHKICTTISQQAMKEIKRYQQYIENLNFRPETTQFISMKFCANIFLNAPPTFIFDFDTLTHTEKNV